MPPITVSNIGTFDRLASAKLARAIRKPAWRASALAVLKEQGLVATAKQVFNLTADQITRLEGLPAAQVSVFESGSIAALETGGSIRFVTGHGSGSVGTALMAKPDDVKIAVEGDSSGKAKVTVTLEWKC